MTNPMDGRMWTPDVVIYHGNCQDGFTGAWVAYKKYGRDPLYYPALHGGPTIDPDLILGKDVLFIDFSYKAGVMMAMSAMAKSIVILDHHVSAQRDLEEFRGFDVGKPGSFNREWSALPAGQNVLAGFDMKRSGAMLAWNFLFPMQEAPLLVSIVQDRDLWKFELSHTKEISMWLFSHDYDFETWDEARDLIEDGTTRNSIIFAGMAIERKHQKDIRELLKGNEFTCRIGGYLVRCANMPYTMASDAANILAQQSPDLFGATYYFDAEGTAHFSLRSIKGPGLDVSEIATKFGGGGHRNAAGFEYRTEVHSKLEL